MNIIEKIKSDLLSISAIVVTILHVFMIVGGVTCWYAVNNVNVMGLLK